MNINDIPGVERKPNFITLKKLSSLLIKSLNVDQFFRETKEMTYRALFCYYCIKGKKIQRTN